MVAEVFVGERPGCSVLHWLLGVAAQAAHADCNMAVSSPVAVDEFEILTLFLSFFESLFDCFLSHSLVLDKPLRVDSDWALKNCENRGPKGS